MTAAAAISRSSGADIFPYLLAAAQRGALEIINFRGAGEAKIWESSVRVTNSSGERRGCRY